MADMMDGAEFEPAAILAELEAEAAGGGFEPLPSVLPVESIGPLPKLFQCRPLNEAHVMELAKAIGGGAIMPPLLVVQVGGRAVLLDGHHRLEAMRLAGEGRPVDVDFFRGTVREAVLAACAANSRTKLPMTKTERTDAAWKFVLFGAFSRSHIAKAAGVAQGTVATMRRVKGKLGGEAFETGSWARALLLANNSNPADMTDEDREEWKERTAQRYADTMARTFGGSLTGNPEVAARALAIHFGRRLVTMVQELGEYLPAEIEGDY